ncbi:MAG: DUF2784 family protein [Proteobacteria bacterium]|nr:DUF2784 family protein [Pseudomonadota bacterium]
MLYRVLADIILVLHFAFILFAVFGGLLVFIWKRFAWVHLPAVVWAALISIAGWICPLTPLENWLREMGGAISYRSGFIDHYILPIVYPDADFLTRRVQILLGLLLFGINLGIYGLVLRRTYKAKQ